MSITEIIVLIVILLLLILIFTYADAGQAQMVSQSLHLL